MIRTLTVALLSAAALGAGGNVAFDYKMNGDDWAGLTDANGNKPYSFCDVGKEQSPIDLTDAKWSDTQFINPNNGYLDDTKSIKIEDHTVKVTVNNGGFEKIFEDDSSIDFTAAQFHFHSPSEHTIDGRYYDLEMHIVHTTNDPSTFGVLGFMFDMERGGSGHNLFISQIENVFISADANKQHSTKVNLKGFLDSVNMGEFWSYDGSLTTPPCSEGVKWTVFKEIQPIDGDQLKRFWDLWAGDFGYANGQGNNRQVQPLNERTLYLAGQDMTGIETNAAAAITLGILFGISLVLLIFVLVAAAKCPNVFGFKAKE